MQRFGQVIGIKREKIEAYEALHQAVWPEVCAIMTAHNMRNYSIFRHESTLFAYFEYVGEDFPADMAAIAAEPTSIAWWRLTDPLQDPFPDRGDSWWTTLHPLFHLD
jgi:L-rhamnose mutarotase